MKNYTYYGLKLDGTAVPFKKEGMQKAFHVTFKFGIKDSDLEMIKKFIGKETDIRVVGYGELYNGSILTNIGYQVEIPEEFAELYVNKAVPHITLWITPEVDESGKKLGKAVNTRNCEFQSVEPFTVPAVFGLFDQNNDFYSSIEE